MLRPLKTLLLAAITCALPFTASKAFDISINIAPPLIPVYEQPPCPEEGYIWTPGYWSYEDEGYYWVPGVWVEPPRIGFLWTPGYWGFADGLYAFHAGYWGPRVGFYGGVNYGCGYDGYGYGGGRWAGNRFLYNTAVTRVNTTVIRNVYVNREVLRERRTDSRVSFNGRGGIEARPTAEQRQAAASPHLRPTETQIAHRQEAGRDRGQLASVNGGRPGRLAVERAGDRGGHDGQGRGDEGRAAWQAERAERRGEGEDGFQRPGREERQAQRAEQPPRQQSANRGDGLMPEERQLAQRREGRAERAGFQTGRREDGGNRLGQDDAARAERRAMREQALRQPRAGQERQFGGEQRRAESQQIERQAMRQQPRRVEGGGERRARREGQGQGRGEERGRRHREGEGQER